MGVELALGPLIRNEWRAAELRLVRPDVSIDIGESGRVLAAGVTREAEADAISIARLSIENGRAVVTNGRTSSPVVLERFWFNGDVRSLAGPIKGEGGFLADNERFGYRLAMGRAGADGVKLKLAIDPSDRMLSVESDGVLRLDKGEPMFEGQVVLARAAAVALADGRAVPSEPWRATSRVKLSGAGARFEQIEFQYGPEERALRLTGAADYRFGGDAKIDAVLSSRHVDLDRVLALPEAVRRLPLVALRSFGESLGGVLRPPAPLRLGIGVDTVTLAGASLSAVRGDLKFDNNVWGLTAFEFRAPGATHMRASGQLALNGPHVTFAGPVALDSNDPKTLVAWLEGRSETGTNLIRPLRITGDVVLGADRIVVEELRADIERKTAAGRLAYGWAAANRPARLEAVLSAAELDIDQAHAFLGAALAGTKLEMPGEMSLALDIGAATVAGMAAKGARAKVQIDGNVLELEKLSVADLDGASFDVTGRIASPTTQPRGNLKLELDARSLNGVMAALAKFAPQMADGLRPAVPLLAPAKLRATLALTEGGAAAQGKAKLAMVGRAGLARLEIAADASGDLAHVMNANLELRAKIESENGASVAQALGFDKVVAIEDRLAILNLTASGRPSGEIKLDGRLVAAGFEGSAKGTVRLLGNDMPSGRLEAAISAADVALFRRSADAPRVPIAMKGRVDFSEETVSLSGLVGNMAGTPLRGALKLVLARPLVIEGNLDADSINAAALVAMAAGMPPGGANEKIVWSTEPFARGMFSDFSGQVEVKALRAAFSPALVVRQFRAVARLNEKEVTFDDVEGSFGGGNVVGRLSLQLMGGQGVETRGRLAVSGADATALLAGLGRPPLAGRFTLQAEFAGQGLTAATVLGSLRGSGTLSVENAQLAGLSPRAFTSAIGAIDKGNSVDAAKVHDMVKAALDTGRLTVARADGAFTINAGQARWGNVIAKADGADLAVTGNIDLTEAMLDARITLSPAMSKEETAAGRPDVVIVLGGPMAGPQRSIDVSSLTGWLTLRAVDRRAKEIESLQVEREALPAGHSAAPAATADPDVQPAAIRADRPAQPERKSSDGATAPAASPTPPAAPTAPPSPTAPAGASAARAAPAEPDVVPPLPAPIEIRPAPATRNVPSAAKKSSRKSDSFFDLPIFDRLDPPPPAPPPARRSIIDTLFGPLR
jgi:large subunit ribosomal protein L24